MMSQTPFAVGGSEGSDDPKCMRKKRGTICPDGTVSDDCSDRKRREGDDEECDDESNPLCRRRKREVECDCDVDMEIPLCSRRKRYSPVECGKEGDPNCTRRKRRSSGVQHC